MSQPHSASVDAAIGRAVWEVLAAAKAKPRAFHIIYVSFVREGRAHVAQISISPTIFDLVSEGVVVKIDALRSEQSQTIVVSPLYSADVVLSDSGAGREVHVADHGAEGGSSADEGRIHTHIVAGPLPSASDA